MLTKSLISKIAYKLFAFALTVFCIANGSYASPSTENPITPAKEDCKLTFVALADTHVGTLVVKRFPYMQAIGEDLHNNDGNIQAVVLAGDITDNGCDYQYQAVADQIGGLSDCRYIATTGNHDIRFRFHSRTVKHFNNFVNYLNNDNSMQGVYHSEIVNGCKFIVIGSDITRLEESWYSDEQLNRLSEELESSKNMPVFVIIHQPFDDTHGLPDAFNNPKEYAGSMGFQSKLLVEMLGPYSNVVVISGHLHVGISDKTYEKIENFNSVNLPAASTDNKERDYNEPGTGYVVEVYEDEILFRARNLAQGIWLPEYDFSIPTDK